MYQRRPRVSEGALVEKNLPKSLLRSHYRLLEREMVVMRRSR